MAAAATKTAAIDGAQLVIHYNFNDPEALWEALQVPGAITSYNTIGRNMANGNKRFALLGDTIGKSALLSKWYQTRASRAEGNELVSRNFNNSNLANAARSHGLEPFIQTHPGQLGSASQGTLADTLEAIVGAVWEDSHSLETVFALLQTMGLDMGL